ncbi:MAG: M6 family metalloprotease domain-containing protein [Bacteroidales bacterium]|nr:M6 family metalloprotease domain-containing protein [Bacteroidales bacterium]
MKKFFLIFALLVCLTNNLFAVKAYPYPITYKQSDNTQLTVSLRGDEKVHWGKTTDDYTLMRAKNGDWVYAIPDNNGGIKPSEIIAHNPAERSQEEISFLANLSKTLFYSEDQISYLKQLWDINADFIERKTAIGSDTVSDFQEHYKLVVILMSYSDLAFSTDRQEIENLFNQVGYSSNGSQGSVHDYFVGSSAGKLNVEATVVGPYTTFNEMNYYGENYSGGGDMRARELIMEAVDAADAEVDFSQYTNDSENYVSCVYVIYAGFPESSGGGANTIWPHRSYLYPPVTKDGVNIYDYACSSEKNGSQYYPEPLVIGTICHEFSHILGLPDFYDTNYEEDGSFAHHDSWDLMCSGNYNNGGKCPPTWNAYQRATRNYINIEELNTEGNITLPALLTDNVAYKLSFNNNEYFILENRQKTSWDKYLSGHGMLIFHVNKNLSGWSNHCINCNPNSPGFDLEEAGGHFNGEGAKPFPGTQNKTSFTDNTTPSSQSFNGTNLNRPITNIAENTTTKNITFTYGQANSNRPSVKSLTADAIIDTVTIDFQIENLSSLSIIEAGVCYSTTNHSPNEATDSKIIATSIQETISLDIIGLSQNTNYYIRPYAKTSTEIGYGEVIRVKTLCSAFDDFPYHESFEEAMELLCWTQESEEFVDNSWIIIDSAHISGAISSAKEGDSWALIKTNRTSGVQNTTLVSSPIDISMLNQPILKFSHTQKTQNSKTDNLTIKYKTSYKGSWTQLNEYTNNISTWTERTIELPSNQDYVILGFEAQVKGGYGVTLDDIQIYDGDLNAYPQVQTISSTFITDVQANISAQLLNHGNNNVHTLGICLSTNPNPTIDDIVILNPVTTETFHINLTDLTPSTTYYVKAFARNNGHISYGEEISFTTKCSRVENYPLFVNTDQIQPCVEINTSWTYQENKYTFTSNSQNAVSKLVLPLLDMSNREATYLSFDRKQLAVSNNNDILRVLYKNSVEGEWIELANYANATTDFQRDSLLLQNLSSTYFIAFEGVSNLSSIELKDIIVYATYQLPIVNLGEANITYNSIDLLGEVIYPGVSEVTNRGICWGTTPDIDITNATIISLGNGIGEFSTTINNLEQHTTYYVRAFATNNNGTSYSPLQEITTLYTPIFNNSIGEDQTICEGTVANILIGSEPTGGDGSEFTYLWIMSTDQQTWQTASIGSDYTGQNLDMRQLYDTTYFRRIVYTTHVFDTSNVVAINVHATTKPGNVFVSSNTAAVGEAVELQLRASLGDVLHWEYKKPDFNWLELENSSNIKILTHYPDQMGEWQYRAVVQNGVCPAKTSGVATVLVDGVGLEDVVNNQIEIKLLPNPSKGKVKFEINSSSNKNVRLEVYDMQSRKVYVEQNTTLNQLSQSTLDLTHLTNGTYLIKIISSEKEEWSEKLIISK